MYLVDAADKALQLVLLLHASESIGVTEAATHLGVARSTAHRLLATLRHRGFAVQSADRRYRAGPALRRAGARRRSTALLVELIAPLMARLRNETEETAHLMVLDGGEVVFLHSEEGRQPLRIGSRVGVRLPAHRTSGGKALLAALDPDEVANCYRDALDDAELTALENQLAGVRASGFGATRGRRKMASARSASRFGTTTGVRSVSVPAVRLTRPRMPELVAALRRCGRRRCAGRVRVGAEGQRWVRARRGALAARRPPRGRYRPSGRLPTRRRRRAGPRPSPVPHPRCVPRRRP